MDVIRQMITMGVLSLRSIPRRAASSLVVIVAMAGVAGVLVAVLAVANGLSHTLAITGRADRAIVLRSGTDAEEASLLPRDTLSKILSAPGVAHAADGKPVISAEMVTTFTVRRGSVAVGSATLRGVSASAWALRPEIRTVAGRVFRPGLHELMVGRAAQLRFPNLAMGQPVQVLNTEWLIVGVFEGGGVHDSELLADAETLLGLYRRASFNAVTVKLTSPQAFKEFRGALLNDPAVSVAVGPEWYYYEAHSQVFAKLLGVVARTIGAVMALGAVFAAMNTLYAAVAARTREIGTLRALGFGAAAVVGSVFMEALLLTLLGALAGAALSYLLFSGRMVSTISGAGVSNVIFRLHIGTGLVMVATAWACFVGLLGGLLPALRAARLPVETALRAT